MATFTASKFIVLFFSISIIIFIANDKKLILPDMYIRGDSADTFVFTHYFICLYSSLSRMGTLLKPDCGLTNIFCVTYPYYIHKTIE